ncbi:hypothetical protein ACFLT0_01495 [Chloroflexota bacterium]
MVTVNFKEVAYYAKDINKSVIERGIDYDVSNWCLCPGAFT